MDFEKEQDFNAQRHTLEFFKTEWGIDKGSLLYKRLSNLPQEQIPLALWASLYTCSHCHNAHIGCRCWDDS